MGRLLDEAVTLADRLHAAALAEDRLQAEYWFENERSGNYLRLHRLKALRFRADKRVDRRSRKYFPC